MTESSTKMNFINVCAFMGLLAHKVEGSGKLWVKFVTFYNPGGKGDNGNCCDGKWGFCERYGGCDHTFTVCVDRFYGSSDMNSCPLGSKITDTLPDQYNIRFGDSIGETSNPMVFSFSRWPVGIKIKVDINDDDYGSSSDDHVDTVITRYRHNQPAPDEASAIWRRLTLSARTTLILDVKEFCDPHWYGSQCSVSCSHPTVGDHYDCHRNTGDKICHQGWSGLNCDVQVNECDSSPCLHGASCNDKLNGYTCVCVDGYQGEHCETDEDECASDPCKHDAPCVDGFGNFSCLCRNGFRGLMCEEDINECASQPCQNNGTCLDLESLYKCVCVPGYTGQNCETEIKECDSNPCVNNGSCSEMIDGYSCRCEMGFTGTNCQTEIDECRSSPCFGDLSKCIDLIAGYDCACPQGWTGRHCDVDIDECVSDPCVHNGTCLNYMGSFSCVCELGWTGPDCETNVDECASSPCPANHTCIDGIGDYQCVCLPGWNGSACVEDIDECLTQPCGEYGECFNTPGSYTCVCLPGWTGDLCEEKMDPCWSQPCANNGSCTSGPNDTVTCNCTRDWRGDHCQLFVDDCSVTPCENGGTCENEGILCHCHIGWFGKHCEHQSQCLKTECPNKRICYDSEYGPRCDCPQGYTGQFCDSPLGTCGQFPCHNNGTCVNGSTCHCTEWFSGYYCENKFPDYCETSPCLNGATCIAEPSGNYSCTCLESFSGPTCSLLDDKTAASNVPEEEQTPTRIILSGTLKEGDITLIEKNLRDVTADYLKTDYRNLHVEIDVSECFSEKSDPMTVLLVTKIGDGDVVYPGIINEVFINITDERFQDIFPLPLIVGEDCMAPVMAAQEVADSGAVMYTVIGLGALMVVAAVVIIFIAVRRKRSTKLNIARVNRNSDDSLQRMNPLYRHYRESGVVLPPSPAGQTITVNPTFTPDNQNQNEYEPFFSEIENNCEEPLMVNENTYEVVMVTRSHSGQYPKDACNSESERRSGEQPKLTLDFTNCNESFSDVVSNENLYESPRINYNLT